MSTIDNETLVIVLQHPNEVNQTKGTLTLLEKSLTRCQVLVGEDFSHDSTFIDVLNQYHNRIALLYPSEHATILSSENTSLNKNGFINHSIFRCIILLDGTWKKVYRMYMLNKNLHNIPHLTLPDDIEGQYSIRSTSKDNALSTLEACCHALGMLEQSPLSYQPLLDNFVQFNQFQLSFNKSRH